MSEAAKLIQGMINEAICNIHTSMPCEVISFDETLCTADIKPLFKRILKDGQIIDYGIIKNASAMKFKSKDGIIVPFYEKGDKVIVTFAERSLDGVGTRKFELVDAVITGLM